VTTTPLTNQPQALLTGRPGALPARTRFSLPPGSEADTPPERRGVPRDGVRLLVAAPGRLEHHVFRDLPELLTPGDLVVVNTSATLPAALEVVRGDGRLHGLHVSTWLDDGDWAVEVRRPDNLGPVTDVEPGERLALPGEVLLRVRSSYPVEGVDGSRLWRATPTPAVPLLEYLPRHGRPIRYGYMTGVWPLSDSQTVYATQPGSAEMPSAGRPFTEKVLVRLMARGVPVAPVVLHAGVSSQEAYEPPLPERFAVPEVTARLVNDTLAAGRRVIAVGTTVVRALESAAGSDGRVRPASGWTDLVVEPSHPVRVVGGLLTGLHAPEASHLLLLEAVAGADLVGAAYQAAVAHGYRWHEFGDVTLFLP
jgi:S-adenosylmethionine:tRNA ribosyltransferase-isomerase